MIYSVFVPSKGTYSYYETSEQKEVNADLPVPTLGADAGKIGVAAIDAARTLPAGARLVGEGWTARGVVASTRSPISLRGFGETMSARVPMWAVAAVAGIAAVALLRAKRNA